MSIGRDEENQAEKYRDDLQRKFAPLEIVVIGGQVSASIQGMGTAKSCSLKSYAAVIAAARAEYDWLVGHLGVPVS